MASVLIGGMAVVDFVFQTDHLPPDPVKYRATDAQIIGGGCAANAAVAVARLGAEATLISRLGQDPVGDMILTELQDEGVDCDFVKRRVGARSAFSSVYVDSAGERQIMNFRGAGLGDDADWIPKSGLHFDAVLVDPRWVEGAMALLELARLREVPGIVDGEAPCDPELVSRASHVAFSEQGLADFAGTDDPEMGLYLAAKRTDAWLCVTRGAAGTLVRTGAGVASHAAFDVDVVDTLAAGDIWHGAFALALAEERSEAEAVRFASAAAALKCMKPGGRAGAPTRSETEEFLKERQA